MSEHTDIPSHNGEPSFTHSTPEDAQARKSAIMMADLGFERVEDRLLQLRKDHTRDEARKLKKIAPQAGSRPSQNERIAKKEAQKILNANRTKIAEWNSVSFNDVRPEDKNLDSLEHGDLHRVSKTTTPLLPAPIEVAPGPPRGSGNARGRGRRASREFSPPKTLVQKLDYLLGHPLPASSRGRRTNESDHAGSARRDSTHRSGTPTPTGDRSVHQQGPTLKFALAEAADFMKFVPNVATAPTPGGPKIPAKDGASISSAMNQKENIAPAAPTRGGLADSRYNPENVLQEKVPRTANGQDGTPAPSTLNQKGKMPVADLPTRGLADSRWNPDNAANTATPSTQTTQAAPAAAYMPPKSYSVMLCIDGTDLGKGKLVIEKDEKSKFMFICVTLNSHPIHVVPAQGILSIKVSGASLTLNLAKPPPKKWELSFQLRYFAQELLDELQDKSGMVFPVTDVAKEELEKVDLESESEDENEDHDAAKPIKNTILWVLLEEFTFDDLIRMTEDIHRKLREDQALFDRTLKPGIENSRYSDTAPVPRDYVPTERDVAAYLNEKPGFQKALQAAEDRARFVAALTRLLVANKKGEKVAANSLAHEDSQLASLPRRYPFEELMGLRDQACTINKMFLPLITSESRAHTTAAEGYSSAAEDYAEDNSTSAPPNPGPVARTGTRVKQMDAKDFLEAMKEFPNPSVKTSSVMASTRVKSEVADATVAPFSSDSAERLELPVTETKILPPPTEVEVETEAETEASEVNEVDEVVVEDYSSQVGEVVVVEDRSSQVDGAQVDVVQVPDPMFSHSTNSPKVGDNKSQHKSGLESSIWAAADDDTPANDTLQLCKYQQNCANPQCPFIHLAEKPTESNVLCRFLPNCKNINCGFVHPVCKFHPRCANPGCRYQHPKVKVPCKFAPKCSKKDCPFDHPESTMECKYNPCMRANCTFKHTGTRIREPVSSMTSRRTSFATAAEETENHAESVSNLNLGGGTPGGLSSGFMSPQVRKDVAAASAHVTSPQLRYVRTILRGADGVEHEVLVRAD